MTQCPVSFRRARSPSLSNCALSGLKTNNGIVKSWLVPSLSTNLSRPLLMPAVESISRMSLRSILRSLAPNHFETLGNPDNTLVGNDKSPRSVLEKGQEIRLDDNLVSLRRQLRAYEDNGKDGSEQQEHSRPYISEHLQILWSEALQTKPICDASLFEGTFEIAMPIEGPTQLPMRAVAVRRQVDSSTKLPDLAVHIAGLSESRPQTQSRRDRIGIQLERA